MKFLSTLSILCFSTILIGTSCSKPGICQLPHYQRKVQFALYTDKDFSNDNHNITFTLSIQKPPGQTLWDSVLAPMKIKEIPNFEQKLVVEKLVPGNDTSTLKVGFSYSIESVGNSWYSELFNAGETFKIVDFNFQ